MKKLFLILLTGIFVSCKKQATDMPIDTMSTGSYSSPAHAYMYTQQAGNYPYKLVVNNEGNGGRACSIDSPIPITAGTYSELAPAGSPVAGISYLIYTGPRNAPIIYAPQGNLNNPVTVTITAVNRSTVRGSFKGTLSLGGSSSSDTVRIEKTEFYARFDRSLYFKIF